MTGLRAGACLSLTGRFAQFGRQAADGLRLAADEFGLDLAVLDDRSDPAVITELLPDLAARTDLLFGPYSTVLIRAAVPVARQSGRLLFNHGGSGGALREPGTVVNVLTPARRYALPFVERLLREDPAPLYVATRRGAFGRDIVAGATEATHAAGLHVETFEPASPPDGVWNLLSAGVYEDDVDTVRAARDLPNPPRMLCSVAAGVAQFAADVADPEGVFGVGQWAPGAGTRVGVGLTETQLLVAWRRRFGATPDYPGMQAYAAGVIGSRAAEAMGTCASDALWRQVAAMDVRTAFGRFRLDPATGEQVGHEAVLTQWHGGRQVIARTG